MALTPPLFAEDLSYPFSMLRLAQAITLVPGVRNPADMIVAAASGLQVSISSGGAVVPQTVSVEGGGSGFYDGVYLCFNDASSGPSNTINAPVVNPRIDQVILSVFDVQEQGLGGASSNQFLWLPGTENGSANTSVMGIGQSNPGAARLPANSLCLVYVLQTVGETSISNGNIKPGCYANLPKYSEGVIAPGFSGPGYQYSPLGALYRNTSTSTSYMCTSTGWVTL